MPFFPVARGLSPAIVVLHSVGQEHLLLTRSGSGDPELRSLGTARDRPSPYGNPGRFFSSTRSGSGLGTARDRPSPYGEGRPFFPVARGPSDATRASERVSPANAAWRGTENKLHRDREGSPTATSLASRPGGLSYRGNGIVQGITKPLLTTTS